MKTKTEIQIELLIEENRLLRKKSKIDNIFIWFFIIAQLTQLIKFYI